MDRLKVVWICHFSNEYIQRKLKIKKKMPEMAPWIIFGIEQAKKRNDVELHIVSPHRWIKGNKEFIDNNIHYHFFNSGIPFYGRHWPSFFRFDFYTKYFFNQMKIKSFVKKINPDIINLHGVENPYYSSSIFKLKSYPILITIQGLKSLSSNKLNSKIFKSDLFYENKIISDFDNFGIRVNFLKSYIKKINCSANFYWFKYPFSNVVDTIKPKNIETDCIFFARVSKDKGVEDIINASYIIKQSKPTFSLKIIGSCSKEYSYFLQEMIDRKGLSKNIKILGFIEDRNELNRYLLGSRIVVLPTYNDILPGTIIESLKAGVPVIAYAANGVVDFNNKEEVIKLVQLGDVKIFANSVVELLNNPNERERMKRRGLEWIKNEADDEIEFDKLVESYKRVISLHKIN